MGCLDWNLAWQREGNGYSFPENACHPSDCQLPRVLWGRCHSRTEHRHEVLLHGWDHSALTCMPYERSKEMAGEEPCFGCGLCMACNDKQHLLSHSHAGCRCKRQCVHGIRNHPWWSGSCSPFWLTGAGTEFWSRYKGRSWWCFHDVPQHYKCFWKCHELYSSVCSWNGQPCDSPELQRNGFFYAAGMGLASGNTHSRDWTWSQFGHGYA